MAGAVVYNGCQAKNRNLLSFGGKFYFSFSGVVAVFSFPESEKQEELGVRS